MRNGMSHRPAWRPCTQEHPPQEPPSHLLHQQESGLILMEQLLDTLCHSQRQVRPSLLHRAASHHSPWHQASQHPVSRASQTNKSHLVKCQWHLLVSFSFPLPSD